MKTFKGFCTYALLISAILIVNNVNLFAQGTKSRPVADVPTLAVDELRPFDFKDKFYLTNGILPAMIVNRHNGEDGTSVREVTNDENYNDVRILATRPAYGREGEIIYWNLYGELYRDGFTDDVKGSAAYETAHNFPVYFFPGENRNVTDRQAPLIDLNDSYFQTNPLGLGVAMLVEYNYATVQTKSDIEFLAEMARMNGRSSDGTPIIRTIRELQQLQRRDLVNVTPRARRGQLPFIMGKVIRYPEHGSLAPDAFLLYTKDAQEKPLAGEVFILEKFRCIQKYGTACSIR